MATGIRLLELELQLDYPWHLEACKRVYTPEGIEQVVDVIGLPEVNNM